MVKRLEHSRNWIVKQEEERERLTHEALADVDAGLIIDHQAVQAWVDGLSTPGKSAEKPGNTLT